MEKNEDESLDEQCSTGMFLSAIAALRVEMERHSKPNRFMVMRPFDEDEDLKLRVDSLHLCYKKICTWEKKNLQYMKNHLLDTTVDENDEVHKLLNVDRIVLSFLESLNYYEVNRTQWTGLVSGFEVFGKRVMSGGMIAPCFRPIFEVREKAVELFRKICQLKVSRKDEQIEEIFEERLKVYSTPRQYMAAFKYRELRKSLPKESADKEFLGDLETLDIVKLYKHYKGEIAKLFNNVKSHKIVEEDMPSLLEYVMRKRIVVTYLEKGGSNSQESSGIGATLANNLPSFAQFIIDPTIAPYILQWLHVKIDRATQAEPVLRVLDALTYGELLLEGIPYNDIIEEFPAINTLISQSTYSKRVGSSSGYKTSGRLKIIEAINNYIEESKKNNALM